MRILLLLLVLAVTAGAETFTTTDGKTYTGKVVSEDPAGITLESDSGIRKIPFSRMEPAVAAQYGYNPKTAQAYQAAQASKRAADHEAQEATQQRQAAARAERRPAEEAKQIEEARVQKVLSQGSKWHAGRVIQVLGKRDYLTSSDSHIFRVIGADKDLVDDDGFKGKFYEVGTWNYEAVAGNDKTVRVLSPVASTPLPADVEPY